MKQLILVRHAKSSWKNMSLDDRDRPLNNRGKRDAPFMASFCQKNSIELDAIFSSPSTRAYSTAKAFKAVYKESLKMFSKETDLYFGSEQDWLYLINNLNEDVLFPAYFSHNPTITYFTNSFADNYIDNVPTCGIVWLRSTVDYWKDLHFNNTKVVNLFFPKEVRAVK